MSQSSHHRYHLAGIQRLLLLAAIAVTLLSACKPTSPSASMTVVPDAGTATLEPAVSPTETPTQAPPGKLILVAGGDVDPVLKQEAADMLAELAPQSGLTLEVREAVQPADISADWRVAVFLSAPPNLGDLANAVPQTQFIAVSTFDQTQASNLTVLRVRPEMIAFAAGYTSVVTALDTRSAGLLPADTALGQSLADAYTNGGRYYCGLCTSYLAPMVQFPLTLSQPGSDANSWLALSDQLAQSIVYVLYVAPEISTPELLTSLAGKGYFLIGGKSPPAEAQSRWIVTIRPNIKASLQEIWPEVSAGQGGQVINTEIEFSDIQPGIFSPGKQVYIQKMVDDLVAGYINVFNPAE